MPRTLITAHEPVELTLAGGDTVIAAVSLTARKGKFMLRVVTTLPVFVTVNAPQED